MWSHDHEVSASVRNRCMLMVGFLFAFGFQKYATRDPLSQSTGMQGFIEAGLTMLVLFVTIAFGRGMPKRIGLHPALLCFGIYGTFALASSINSYDVKLSIVKGVLFFCILLIAYFNAELHLSMSFLDGVYRGYIATLLGGLALGLMSPGKYPLFSVDNWNGRTRLTLLSTHPNSIGEVSSLLLLLAQVLPIRTKWYWQGFLLGISILAGEKTATIAVFLCSGIIFLFGKPASSRRWGVVLGVMALGCVGIVCVQAGVLPGSGGKFAGHLAASIYGTEVSNEVGSMDGRADVWRGGIKLARDSVALGYGFDGARDALLKVVSWSGQAHNGFLEAALSAGLVGLTALVAGWIAAVKGSLSTNKEWNTKVLSLNLYLFSLAMIGPIFDSPSFFAILLFVTVLYVSLDCEVEAEAARASGHRGRVASLELPSQTCLRQFL
jgi:O-antigen ligase